LKYLDTKFQAELHGKKLQPRPAVLGASSKDLSLKRLQELSRTPGFDHLISVEVKEKGSG
jgi:hypothetical protein